MGKSKTKNYHAATNSRDKLDFSTFLDYTFQNPYNDNDYDILEDLWTHTLVGKAIDLVTEFTIGEGIKPFAEPIDDTITDNAAKQKIVEKYHDQLLELKKIDMKPHIEIDEHIDDLVRSAMVFGRSVLAFEPTHKQILAIKPLHSRDLGRVFTHRLDWSISSIHAFGKTQNILAEDMIYLVNMRNSPRRRSMHYGFSEAQRPAGFARALRKIQEVDMPETAEALWAKSVLFRVDQEGLAENEKLTDLKTLRTGTRAGAINFVNGKKDEFEMFSLDTEPKIQELGEIINKAERAIIGNFGIPGAVLGREEESNMATMLGKIRFFIASTVRSRRRWLEKTLVRQWYNSNFQTLEGGLEALNEIQIKVRFEPIVIEGWIDIIDSLNLLKATIPSIPDEELLKLAHLEDLTDKLGSVKASNVMQPNNLRKVAATMEQGPSKTKVLSLAASLESIAGTNHAAITL